MRWSSVLPLLLSLCACGLTVRGSALPDGGEESLDASVVDAGDASADVDVDVDAAPPCEVVSVEDQFTTVGFDPAKWIAMRNTENQDYPKPYFTDRPLASMLEPTKINARAGLWHVNTVPFAAFDIELDIHAVCTTNCGDGIAINFLDAAVPLTKLDEAQPSLTLGVPSNLNGAAVALDLTQNAALGDGPAPSVQILEIDATKTPGQYDWTLATSPQDLTLRNKTHRFVISYRAPQVTVRVNGVVVTSGAMPRLPAEGTFGFSASSGGYTAGIYIGDVRAKFYRCSAP